MPDRCLRCRKPAPAGRPTGRARAASPQPELLGPRSSPDVLRLIASWNVPAPVLGPRLDVLVAIQLGNALFPANQCGAVGLFDPASRKFYVDWDEITESSVALCARTLTSTPTTQA
ncbi:MmyB family transcriptional regulator [Streptomyces sp. NPDC001970]